MKKLILITQIDSLFSSLQKNTNYSVQWNYSLEYVLIVSESKKTWFYRLVRDSKFPYGRIQGFTYSQSDIKLLLLFKWQKYRGLILFDRMWNFWLKLLILFVLKRETSPNKVMKYIYSLSKRYLRKNRSLEIKEHGVICFRKSAFCQSLLK